MHHVSTSDSAPLAHQAVGTGTSVLLLPAFPADHRMYDYLLREPIGRVIAVDPPGFGASSLSDGAPSALPIEAYAERVIATIEALHLERPVVGGTGLGGYVALEVCVRLGSAAAGLVLSGCVASPDPAAKASKREALADAALSRGPRSLSQELTGATLASAGSQRSRQIFSTMVEESDPKGFAALSRGLAIRPDPTPRLKQVTVPSLVLCGDQDPYASVSAVREVAELLRVSSFAVLRGGGHLLALEKPHVFRRTLVDFLSSSLVT